MNLSKITQKEAKMPINQLFTAEKMRQLTTTYKRHTIHRFIRPQNQHMRQPNFHDRIKQNVADYFFVYCRQVIPRIEQSIELSLLEKFSTQITNPLERQEVIASYLTRRENLAKLPDDDGLNRNQPRLPINKSSLDDYWKIIQNIDGEGLRYHTVHDIGRFTVFPDNHFKRMFPGKCFGELEEIQKARNNIYGVMTREEGLRLTNQLDQLTLPSQRDLPYAEFAQMSNKEFKTDVLHEEKLFIQLYQDLSIALLDYIEDPMHSEEHRLELKTFFTPASLFDSLVSILVQEMRRKPMRQHLATKESRNDVIHQIVVPIHEQMVKSGRNRPQKFGDICEVMTDINLSLKKSLLPEELSELQKKESLKYKLFLSGYHKICKQLWRPVESRRIQIEGFKGINTGALFWGEKGCGKSQLLTYLTAWAHEKSWMVFTVPSCEEISGGTEKVFRYKNGLYLQEELALRLLQHFKHSNEQSLLDFDVNMERYGHYDITGVRDTEPEPCPRTWDAMRQCWNDEWKEKLYDFEIKVLEQQYEDMDYRMKDKLPEPKKLIEVVDMGIDDPKLATNAFAEVLEQLYHTDQFQVLVAVDGFNDWLKPSGFPSFRYENSAILQGHIPPQDIALIRLLMKFDGHFIRNGVKMMATTHKRQFNHIATPEMMDFQHGYCRRVENMALNDFRNALRYYYMTGWNTKYFREHVIESYFMTSQGNWSAFHQSHDNYLNFHY